MDDELRAAMIALLWFLLLASGVMAQTSHDLYHINYQNWVNGLNQGCCNDRDCKELSDADQRSHEGRLEVYVHGVSTAYGQAAWCPVMPHHYLKQGNAPDWTTAHICVTSIYGGTTPCGQFVCYQPRPLT